MKKNRLLLMLVLITCTLAMAQNNAIVKRDSVEKVKAGVKQGSKANRKNTAMTVIGVDTAETASTQVYKGAGGMSHGSASFTVNATNGAFPFGKLENIANGGILIAIIGIIAVFALPVLILFVVFFFRYKNRKARYHLVEQALAAGQPLPAYFIREHKPVDPSSQGIKNTFTGIGLFIFLWGITGEFGIGTIGLLVAFMGVGQWIIGYRQKQNDAAKTNSPTRFSAKSEEKGHESNEEKNEEEK